MPVSFDSFIVGAEYTRHDLAAAWRLRGFQALGRGAFTPRNQPYIVLMLTHEKQASATQYQDTLEDGILLMEGEGGHRTDRRFVEAEAKGDQIHLFYRSRHHMPFTYEGEVFLTTHTIHTDKPSKFTFVVGRERAAAAADILTEEKTHGIADPDLVPDTEGEKKVGQHVYYERRPEHRATALAHHGRLCACCGFDFDAVYGADLARGYIEVHHVRSITEQSGKPFDPHADLVPLCSNCHSMVHRPGDRILTVAQLKAIIARGTQTG
jgi:5-methylcytosine-specific restriction enzyme A